MGEGGVAVICHAPGRLDPPLVLYSVYSSRFNTPFRELLVRVFGFKLVPNTPNTHQYPPIPMPIIDQYPCQYPWEERRV